MRIKVPIVVNEDKEWFIMASSEWSEGGCLEESRGNLGGDYCRVFWIEVDIPEPPENVLEGKSCE